MLLYMQLYVNGAVVTVLSEKLCCEFNSTSKSNFPLSYVDIENIARYSCSLQKCGLKCGQKFTMQFS